MEFEILCFGIIRDMTGSDRIKINFREAITVGELKSQIQAEYPEVNHLNRCMIAVDQTYAQDNQVLNGTEEIALIPPVSGG